MRRTVILAAAAVAALAIAPQAPALSRAKANQIALKILAPQSQPGNVVVFGLPAPLKRTDAVFEGGTPTATNTPFTLAAKPFGKKVWLFWEDLAYGARFEHPSKLLVLDDRNGRIVSTKNLSWYPLVDGVAPAFVGGAYQSNTYKIYSSVPASRVAVAWQPRWISEPPLELPPNAFKEDCVIMIGLRRDDQFKHDFEGMTAAAGRYGINAYTVNTGTAGVDPNGQDLRNVVKQVVKDPINCKDVMIFISGHGYQSGPTAVNVGTRTTPAGTDARGRRLVRVRPAVVTSDDLIDILKDNPRTTFKFVIDSCFSGRFLIDIDTHEHSNVAIMTTASKADTYSYSFVPAVKLGNGQVVQNQTSNPGVTSAGSGRGEFTNGMLGGMEQFATSAAAVRDAQTAGGSLLARMLAYAFDHEKSNDFAAQTGLTVPREAVNISSNQAPTVTPIGAVFIQADFATYYGVLASDPENDPLTFTWSLKPPVADPNCKLFSQVAGEATRAVWYHGDQHGCNHAVEGPDGHEGTVTLVVSDGHWQCTETYLGTNTGTGKEGACVPKA